jgi:hypothetical protein
MMKPNFGTEAGAFWMRLEQKGLHRGRSPPLCGQIVLHGTIAPVLEVVGERRSVMVLLPFTISRKKAGIFVITALKKKV